MREKNIVVLTEGMDSTPDPDPEIKVYADSSHAWIDDRKWSECARCGMRDYFAGAADQCAISQRGVKKKIVSPAEGQANLTRELKKFFETWTHGARSSMEDWAAEWFEWRRKQK